MFTGTFFVTGYRENVKKNAAGEDVTYRNLELASPDGSGVLPASLAEGLDTPSIFAPIEVEFVLRTYNRVIRMDVIGWKAGKIPAAPAAAAA